jgi:hypothetical protein
VDGLKPGTLEAMERAMRREPTIEEALSVKKIVEVSIYFALPLDDRDESKGFVQCKACIDSLPQDGEFVDDLKTIRSASHDEFGWSIRKYGYDRQADWYLRACHMVGLKGKSRFRWLVQENTAPYVATLYELPATWLNFANKEGMKTFFELRAAIQSEEWRGYVSGQVLPPRSIEEIVEQESSTPFKAA